MGCFGKLGNDTVEEEKMIETIKTPGTVRHHAHKNTATGCITIAYQAYIALHQWCIVKSCDDFPLHERLQTEREAQTGCLQETDTYGNRRS